MTRRSLVLDRLKFSFIAICMQRNVQRIRHPINAVRLYPEDPEKLESSRKKTPHMTTPELLAIRWGECQQSPYMFRRSILTGQSSAASFPTGPVMAEPFISPLGLTIYTQHR